MFPFCLGSPVPAPSENTGEPPSQCEASQTAGCQPLVLAVLEVSGSSSFDSTCSDPNHPCCHCSDIRTDSLCPFLCLPGKHTRSQSWQAQRADSGAFWMGQCQKTDRPSCTLKAWFPELFPGMKTRHRPSQISTLVPRHAHGSLESAVAPPVSLVFVFPLTQPHFPRLQDPVLVFGYMHYVHH